MSFQIEMELSLASFTLASRIDPKTLTDPYDSGLCFIFEVAARDGQSVDVEVWLDTPEFRDFRDTVMASVSKAQTPSSARIEDYAEKFSMSYRCEGAGSLPSLAVRYFDVRSGETKEFSQRLTRDEVIDFSWMLTAIFDLRSTAGALIYGPQDKSGVWKNG